jgi:hypothetical protein
MAQSIYIVDKFADMFKDIAWLELPRRLTCRSVAEHENEQNEAGLHTMALQLCSASIVVAP